VSQVIAPIPHHGNPISSGQGALTNCFFLLIYNCNGICMMSDFGKILVFFGLILIVVGLIFLFGPKIPWLGKLPGDITIKKENFIFYFPLATSLVISILLTILFSLFRR
jgi:Protein of unknown function (DUF2905)